MIDQKGWLSGLGDTVDTLRRLPLGLRTRLQYCHTQTPLSIASFLSTIRSLIGPDHSHFGQVTTPSTIERSPS